MTGTLYHQPSDVIAQLLVDLSLGTDPEDESTWPVYCEYLPDTPANTIAVYDSEGRNHGRAQVTGETQKHYGIQVMVRGMDLPTASEKTQEMLATIDGLVEASSVTLGLQMYTVGGIHLQGSPRKIFMDGRRYAYSTNFLTTMQWIAELGT